MVKGGRVGEGVGFGEEGERGGARACEPAWRRVIDNLLRAYQQQRLAAVERLLVTDVGMDYPAPLSQRSWR